MKKLATCSKQQTIPMNKSIFNFSEIKATKKKVDALAETVATAEAEVILAEEALTVARRDDGTVDPGQLIQRIDAADHSFRVRQIEANRAAAKLTEAEHDFHSMIREAVEPVTETLMSRLDEEKERIRKLLVGIIGEGASARRTHEVDMVVGFSESVIRISGRMTVIYRAKLDVAQGFDGAIGALIETIIGAEQLL